MVRRIGIGLTLLGALLLVVGAYSGLVLAPPDSMMGDVYRILYTHVPAAWMALLAFTLNCFASVFYLMRSSLKADAIAEAAAETGVIFATGLLVTGSIWAKPTWGTWWTWDPRLTSMAIVWLSYLGYLTLRRFVVDDPDKRATWSATAGILIGVGVPIVWYSVKWWNSIHQVQSNPDAVDGPMAWVLRLNAFAFLFLWLGFLLVRYGIARHEQAQSLTAPPVMRQVQPGEAVAS
ncbi:MAG: cytochrome c biogenesis protein CcsA [Myxococcota bacterium]